MYIPQVINRVVIKQQEYYLFYYNFCGIIYNTDKDIVFQLYLTVIKFSITIK